MGGWDTDNGDENKDYSEEISAKQGGKLEGKGIKIGERSDYIRLDVGSTLHLCHRDTLMKFPDSLLAKCVSPEFDKRKSDRDFIIVDRDGKHFGTILGYMRDPKSLNLSSWEISDLEELRSELDYYGLTEPLQIVEQEIIYRESKYELNPASTISILTTIGQVENVLQNTNKQTVLMSMSLLRELRDTDIKRITDSFDHKRRGLFATTTTKWFDNQTEIVMIDGGKIIDRLMEYESCRFRDGIVSARAEVYSWLLFHHTH